MSQLHRPNNSHGNAGFTLMEVMVAITILTVGLLSVALMMANVYKTSVRSRYMSLASLLASEKLEDLCSYGLGDPRAHLTGGLLTSDPTQVLAPVSAPWNSSQVTVVYYDTVTFNNNGGTSSVGAMNESFEILNQSGTTYYVTQSFTADGLLHWYSAGSFVGIDGNPHYYPSNPTTTAPTGETFLRTWQIQQNTPAGLTTITVEVALIDSSFSPPVTFQMTTVRP
jgi:prepilin-type N-terminal cleavage/methylation domain-containing protein